MNDDVPRSLNRVLGLQLAAVQQHFIHVLMLRAWNEEAIADRITSIDAVDLPNAMRIVDHMVSTGHLPTLASDHRTSAGNMPRPGGSLNAVYAAEMRLDCRLTDVLTSGLVILLYKLLSRTGAGGSEKGSRRAMPVR